MLRSRFRRTTERVFQVDLTVHRLDSIPSLYRLLYVHWQARRAVPAEGRTPSLPVEPGNLIRWDSSTRFTVTIPSDPSDASILQPAPLILHLRSERRTRWLATQTFANEGSLRLDLADLAAVGHVSRNFLLQDSLLNATLNLSIRVAHHAGDRIFRTRALAALPPSPTSSDTLPPTAAPAAAAADPDSHTPFISDSNIDPPLPAASLPRPYQGQLSTPLAQGPSARPPRTLNPAAVSAPVLLAPSDSETEPPPPFPRRGAADLERDDDTRTVLQSSIPDPVLVQRHIYEQMFQARVRDGWPAHIDASRVDATEEVNRVYADVCAMDGIGVSGFGRPRPPAEDAGSERVLPGKVVADNTLSLEAMLESRNAAPQRPSKTVSQMPLVRKASGHTPAMAMRSTSMGEISVRKKVTV